MKSIFSLAIILTFVVSSVCMTGCSDPETNEPKANEKTAADGDMDKEPAAKGDMDEKDMDKEDGSVSK